MGSVLPQPLLDELVAGQLQLLRLEAGVRADVVNTLNQLQRELVAALANEDLTAFTKARTASLLVQVNAVVDTYYGDLNDQMLATLTRVGEVKAAAAAGVLDTHFAVVSVDVALPTGTFLARLAGNTLIMGATNADWWDRQAEDVKFRFANVVRTGIAQGEDTGQIVARVAGRRGYPGVMDVSRTNARSLVHTSIMEVAGAARRETYQQNADVVEGTQQVSTLDSHTSDICIAYDGASYDLDGNPLEGTELPWDGGVPRHWGCRSVEVPITKTFAELGIDAPEPDGGVAARASVDGPVPADMTFDKFLERMGPEFQDETLGPGRAQLWRHGAITLPQLLDLKGNPLTLDELQAKYA